MPAYDVFSLMLIRSAGLPFSSLAELAADWKTAENTLVVGATDRQIAAQAVQAAFDAALRDLADDTRRTAVYNLRKAFFKKNKLPPRAVLARWASDDRHPALLRLASAIATLMDAAEELNRAEADFQKQYETALKTGIQALQQIAGREPFQRALLFSSHALLVNLDRFRQTPVEYFSKKERQITQAVLQYAARMATKTTPLSRFATVAVRALADSEQMEPAPFGKTLVAPNVALLEALYAVLLREPAFYRALAVQLNPCIVEVAAETFTWLYFDGETESFQDAEANGFLQFLAELLLKNGRQLPFEKLLDELCAAVEAERAALEQKLQELLDLGFLEWILPEYGLAPGWSGRLYEFLGRLAPEPLIVETAALMQWLRTAARTLPHQSVTEALQTQRDTQAQIRQYFERQKLALPPIPAERLFYEDVEQPVEPVIPEQALRTLLGQLADCWAKRPEKPLPESRAAFFEFIKEKTAGGQAVGFLELCRAFSARPVVSARPATQNRRTGTVGALLQPFQENGQWHAVVNGLYPGGGKMFARWLPLFSPEVTEALRAWQTKGLGLRAKGLGLRAEGEGGLRPLPSAPRPLPSALCPFPWQGYFNANCQPQLSPDVLLAPGGRLRPAAGGAAYQLGDLEVFWENGPRLRDRPSGQLIELADLGLEAPETRPPVMQLLWRLAVPYVSLEQLLPDDLWTPVGGSGIWHRARYCFQNLVLARAAWRVEPAAWQPWLEGVESELDFFQKIRRALAELGIPRHFFAAFEGESAQYFDLDSPLFVQLFFKMLRQGGGGLWVWEMLPAPGEQAREMVYEFAVFNGAEG